LKAKPKAHNQRTWIRFDGEGNPPEQFTPELDCGSAFCIAGATVARAGAVTPVWENGFDWETDEYGWVVRWVRLEGSDNRHYIGEYAAELLGLDEYTADALFEPSNTMDDIDRIRDMIAGGVEDDENAQADTAEEASAQPSPESPSGQIPG
jgi:hypothetical protein